MKKNIELQIESLYHEKKKGKRRQLPFLVQLWPVYGTMSVDENFVHVVAGGVL